MDDAKFISDTDNHGIWTADDIIHRVGEHLQAMITHNEKYPPSTKEHPELFHNFYTGRTPPISIEKYLTRIAQHAKPGVEALLQVPTHIRILSEVWHHFTLNLLSSLFKCDY